MNYLLINANSKAIPLKDESVHLVVTSPPYYNAREYSQWATYEDYLADMVIWWAECYRVLINGGRIAVNVPHGYGRNGEFGYTRIGEHAADSLTKTGFVNRGYIIWHKLIVAKSLSSWGSWMSASNPVLRDNHEIILVMHKGSDKREPGESTINRLDFLMSTESVWNIAPKSSSWHPAPFPAEIPRRLIELYSYKGDTVLDLFSGSGTTVKVAGECGRNGIGIDFTMEYLTASISDIASVYGDWDTARKYALCKPKQRLTLNKPDGLRPEQSGANYQSQLWDDLQS